ncbi:CRISPR-associated protein Cas5 [Parafrankia sp. EUN1f]|uniref:CRISPR-associated protein Cas5 n=1 Tax=Parafrankia sp. EUN1f TaxID=102897 RepID=UPI0001C46400|nr:CRISPR-associated protein Cas5 [Parafrankia sp. EUN1f]EFC81106.1 CRISPR-associated protein Cas5 [Parafrankia sp. EUN1f]
MTAADPDPGLSPSVADAVMALQVTVTAPIVSFRNPLYSSVALCLPCPPPATVGGLLAAVAGGWEEVDPGLRFAMAFTAEATGIDLETFHPLEQQGKRTDPVPRERHFLAGAKLTIWLVDDVELWRARFRRPVWPLRLGRSQDLATARTTTVTLRRGQGRVGGALLPADIPSGGTLLQLPTAISRDRSRTRWEPYRHHRSVGGGRLGPDAARHTAVEGWAAPDGRAVCFLPSAHPATVEVA